MVDEKKDKKSDDIQTDDIIYGFGETLMMCDDQDFKCQIQDLSEDDLKKYLDEDNATDEIKSNVLERRFEVLGIRTKNKYLQVDNYETIMKMPDDQFKIEIASMSDNGLERYMKKLVLSSWEKGDIRARRLKFR